MIQLFKKEKPQILVERESEWTSEYLEAVRDGVRPLPRRWSHSEIRSTLLEETAHRCAYCDSRLEVTVAGDVEHILPRSARPDLALCWSNLTLACSVCNRSKSNYYSAQISFSLVHPYEEDPADHFVFAGPFIHSKDGTDRSRLTIERLALLRLALVERRKNRIDEIEQLIFDYKRAPAQLKRPILDHLSRNVRAGEFRATVSSFMAVLNFDIAREEQALALEQENLELPVDA